MGPVIELSIGCTLDILNELRCNFFVKFGVFAESDVHAPVDLRRVQRLVHEPERQDCIDSQLIIVSNRCIMAVAEKFYRHINVFVRSLDIRLRAGPACQIPDDVPGHGQNENHVTENSRSGRS